MEMWLFAIACTATGFLGTWLTGNKKWYGPLVRSVGLLGWIVYDILNEQWPLILFPTSINLLLQFRNAWKWWKEARTAARQAFSGR